MSTPYTDADVQAATAAMREASGLAVASLSRVILDAVAPAIAARALREAADRYAAFTRPDSGLIHPEWTDGFMEALDGTVNDLRARADEIERGTP